VTKELATGDAGTTKLRGDYKNEALSLVFVCLQAYYEFFCALLMNYPSFFYIAICDCVCYSKLAFTYLCILIRLHSLCSF